MIGGLRGAEKSGETGVLELGPTTPKARFSDPWAGKIVKDGPHVQGMVMARLQNAPKVGEMAPGLTVTDALSGKPISLGELNREKPVVLFFLSYSCSLSHDSIPPMKDLADRFGKKANFVLIYIREAHPLGGFHCQPGAEKFMIQSPNTLEERSAAALRFAKESQLPFPVLVDSMDDAAAVRWAAWPVRLFVVDQQGKVIFAGQQGPWFHKPTRTYDPHLEAIPEDMRNLPGYSRESLEEFLERLTNTRPASESAPRPEPTRGGE
ncbi:MAG: redoxin domain-containing protein [Verrucomicrobiae bacterium]|nr:redoxin domain-containing protein [Verrucomicrobiae bacterium]